MTVDTAKAILDRATAHADTLAAKLDAARAIEHDHDKAAMARLHAALQSGDALAETTDPLRRSSAGLEEDLRTARLTIDRLDADHKARLADLGKADDGVNLAVEAVLAAEAEMVAQEVTALRARAAILTRQVRAYANHTPVRRGVRAAADLADKPARPITPGSLLLVRDPAPVAPLRTRQTPAVLQALQPVASVMFETPALAEAEAWQVFERSLVQHADATADFASDPVDAPMTSATGFPRPVSLSSSRVA